MSNPIGSMVGPGSQPADEDGGVLDYMSMPSGMMIFAAPDLPEPEDTEDLTAGKAALEDLLQLLEDYDPSGTAGRADFSKLDAANLELVNQVLDVGQDAFGNDFFLAGRIVILQTSQQVVLLRAPAERHLLLTAEMVDAGIVCDPQHPRKELPFLIVLPTSEYVHHFDEDVLKEVSRQIMVADQQVQLGVHLVAMTGEEDFKGALVALLELRDQRAVWGGLLSHDTTNCARTV